MYKYIEFFFYRRLKHSCLNVSKTIYRPSILLNRSSFHSASISFFRSLKMLKISFERRYNNFSFLNHFTNFISFFNLLKKKLLNIKSNFFFVLSYLLKKYKELFSRIFISYLSNNLYFFLMIIEKKMFSYNNKNILFILYQIKVLKEVINKKFFYFMNKKRLVSIFIKYLKNTLDINSMVRIKNDFENKYSYFIYKCKLKNINTNLNNIYSFYTYLNIFLNSFHNSLIYLFYFSKNIYFPIKLYKIKLSSVFNCLNIHSKKTFFLNKKNKFSIFKLNNNRKYFTKIKTFRPFSMSTAALPAL